MNNIENKDLKDTSFIFKFFKETNLKNRYNHIEQLCDFVKTNILKIEKEENIKKICNNIKFNTNNEITLNDVLKAILIINKIFYIFENEDNVKDDTFAKLLMNNNLKNNIDPLYYNILIRKIIKILFILFKSKTRGDSISLLEMYCNKKINELLNKNNNNSILQFILNNNKFISVYELSDKQIISIIKLFNNNNSNNSKILKNYNDIKILLE